MRSWYGDLQNGRPSPIGSTLGHYQLCRQCPLSPRPSTCHPLSPPCYPSATLIPPLPPPDLLPFYHPLPPSGCLPSTRLLVPDSWRHRLNLKAQQAMCFLHSCSCATTNICAACMHSQPSGLLRPPPPTPLCPACKHCCQDAFSTHIYA